MPAFTRLTNPEAYEQAVLKYMAKEGCDRKVVFYIVGPDIICGYARNGVETFDLLFLV